jgi:hypothetical protein
MAHPTTSPPFSAFPTCLKIDLFVVCAQKRLKFGFPRKVCIKGKKIRTCTPRTCQLWKKLLCKMSSMQKRSQILLWPPPHTTPPPAPAPLPQNECFRNWSTLQSKVVWDANTGRKEGSNEQYFMRICRTCTLPSLEPKPKTCNPFSCHFMCSWHSRGSPTYVQSSPSFFNTKLEYTPVLHFPSTSLGPKWWLLIVLRP